MSYEGSRLAASRLPSSVPLTTADNVFSNKNAIPSAVSNVPSTNLLLNSDGALSRYSASNVTDAPGTISNFTNAIAFGNNSVLRSAFDGSYTMTVGFVYTFSCFVQMDDGSAPVPGTNASSAADFAIMFGGTSLIRSDTNCVVTLAYGNVYRVSLTFTASSTKAGIGVAKYTANSAKTFKVTGYQLEQQNLITPSAILTRSSVATLDSVDYAANVPRYTQGGVLVEEAGTNLFTNADGNLSTYTRSQNVSDAPGTIPGFSNAIAFGNNSLFRYAPKQNYTTIVGTIYTFSCYVKMDDGNAPVPGGQAASADFALVINNTIVSTPTNCIVTQVSESVYRVSVTHTATAAGTIHGVYKYQSNSIRTFKVTGYQLEIKPYVTSYIDSGATAGTRSADVLRIPNLGFVQGGWAFAFTMRRTTRLLDPIYSGPTVFNFGASLSEFSGIYLLSNGNSIDPPQLSLIMRSNNVGYNIVTNKTIAFDKSYRIAVTGNGSVAKIAVDGVIVGTLNYVESPVPIGSTCQLGKDMSAIFSNFAFSYKALTDQELQDLSLGSTEEVNARWTLNNQLTAATTTAQVSDYIETTTTEGVRYDFETTAAVKAENGVTLGQGLNQIRLLRSGSSLTDYDYNLNVTGSVSPISGFGGSVYFVNNAVTAANRREVRKFVSTIAGVRYKISAYIQMDDGSAPLPHKPNVYYGDFTFAYSNGSVNNAPADCVVRQVSGSIYEVSGEFTADGSETFIAIYKYDAFSTKALRAADLQLYYANSSVSASLTRSSAATINGTDYVANAPRYINNGLLVEETTTNRLTDTDGAVATYGYNSQVANSPGFIPRFTNAVSFGDASVQREAIKMLSIPAGTTATFSCFVKMDDGGVPVPGGIGVSTDDFSIWITGSQVSKSAITTVSVGGGVYRVSATLAVTGNNTNNGIVKGIGNSSRGFKVAGYQIELKGYATSYAESGASIFTRAAEVLTVPTAGWTKNSWAFGMTIRRTTTGLTNTRSLPVIMRLTITAGTNDVIIYIDNSADATRENAVLLIRSNGTIYRAESLVPIKCVQNILGFHAEYRIAITGDGRTAKMAINGVIVASMPYVEPLGTIPGFITIGEDVSGVYSDISIINRALSDYELCELSLGLYVNAAAEWTLNNQLSAKVNTVTLASDPTLPMHAVTKQYVDSKLVPTIVVNEIPSGTINGTNRVFTVQNTPISGSLELFQNGIVLLPTTHYTISGSTITYVSGFQPVVGETHCVHYRY